MLVIAVCSSAALAEITVPHVSARARSAIDLALAPAPEGPVCRTIEPGRWRDASDARFFATGATARLDDQELAAGTLAPLVSLQLVRGTLRLFLLGSPMRPVLHFTTAGWQPRWPFC